MNAEHMFDAFVQSLYEEFHNLRCFVVFAGFEFGA